MWNIESIYLKNFRSHKETKYKLKQNTLSLVYGHNFDESDSSDSNGTGKSTILYGITIALVGIPDKNLSASDYVMDGEEFAVIELEMSNKAMGLKVRISRTLYAKIGKSAKFFLHENEEQNNQITKEREGTAYILEDLLDITKEDLLNYFIINQNNSHSFFNATDGKKKVIIARFSGADEIDTVINNVKEDEAVLLKVIEDCEVRIGKYEREINHISEQIEYEQTGRVGSNKELLMDFEEGLKEVEKECEKSKRELSGFDVKISQIEAKLNKTNGFSELIEDYTNKKKKSRKDLRGIEKSLREIEKILAGSIICPKCEYEFSLSKNVDFEDCRVLEKKMTLRIKKIETRIKTLNEGVELLELKDEKFSKLEKRLKDFKWNMALKVKGVKRLEREIVDLSNKIKKIKSISIDKKRVESLKTKEIKYFKMIESLKQDISERNEELEEVLFWKVNFGVVGFKTFLINKTLSNLEGHVNSYLKKFKTDLKVKINGFKVLRGGDVRENIDILINKSGKGWKKFKRFSGGQRERANICCILTLQKLINYSSKSGGLNFLGLDETFEGLDIKGQQMVLPILENCGSTIMMITHMNYDIGAKNVLNIDYKNEISKIRNGKEKTEKSSFKKASKTR